MKVKAGVYIFLFAPPLWWGKTYELSMGFGGIMEKKGKTEKGGREGKRNKVSEGREKGEGKMGKREEKKPKFKKNIIRNS